MLVQYADWENFISTYSITIPFTWKQNFYSVNEVVNKMQVAKNVSLLYLWLMLQKIDYV